MIELSSIFINLCKKIIELVFLRAERPFLEVLGMEIEDFCKGIVREEGRFEGFEGEKDIKIREGSPDLFEVEKVANYGREGLDESDWDY